MNVLMSAMCWGEIQCPFVQKVCAAAVADGCEHPDVIKVSKMGASGTWPGNIYRDLQKKMPKQPLHDALSTMKLPMKVRTKTREEKALEVARCAHVVVWCHMIICGSLYTLPRVHMLPQ